MQLSAGVTVLVTGSSGGIGAAVARLIAARGAQVVLHGRDGTRLDALAADLGSKAIAVDLLAPGGPAELAERCGSVDVLVHCAGAGWYGRLPRMPAAEAQALIELNLTACVHLTAALLPAMLARSRGHVAFIGSIAGLVAVREEAVYAASKAGLLAFADSLRLELDGTGVGVSTVSPAAVDTNFWLRRGVGYNRRVPRMVAPDRVARVVVDGIEHDRVRRLMPRWLGLATFVRSGAPGLYHRLAGRFG